MERERCTAYEMLDKSQNVLEWTLVLSEATVDTRLSDSLPFRDTAGHGLKAEGIVIPEQPATATTTR